MPLLQRQSAQRGVSLRSVDQAVRYLTEDGAFALQERDPRNYSRYEQSIVYKNYAYIIFNAACALFSGSESLSSIIRHLRSDMGYLSAACENMIVSTNPDRSREFFRKIIEKIADCYSALM